jgi:hypothetical protein
MLLLLVACAPSEDAPAEEVTYYRDVRPILDRSCARCHSPAATATSFEDPAAVQALASSIRDYTQSGQMPPPAPNPGCADYVDSETYFLPDSDKAVLAAWADAGAPLGDPADAPTPWTPATTAPFDAEIYPDAPYNPSFGDTGNDYRCFLLELNNDHAEFVTGFEALIDNPAIVHHVVLWQLEDSVQIPTSDDGKPGWACGGFGGPGYDFFAGWAPGGSATMAPDGMGFRVPKNARFALQMHYFESYDGADQEQDQSGFGLHLADDVDTRLFTMPLGVEDFTIPAGDPDHTEQMLVPWPASYGDVTILSTFPHMHLLGSGFEFKVAHADGSESCVADLNGWDFHNQINIALKDPVTITAGDAVTVTCRWDNSANNPNQLVSPPEDVHFGERTNDEMCYAFTVGYQP